LRQRCYKYFLGSITVVFFGCPVGAPPGDSAFDCGGIPGTRGERIALELVATGLGNPTDIQSPPGERGRLMIASLDGRIHVINLPGDTVAATPYFDLGDTSSAGWNLSGLAFHPEYQQNGYLYVNYRRSSDNHLLISRFTAPRPSANADPDSELILIDLPPPEWDHDGGPLSFGPFDGYLYVAIGDGGPQTELTAGMVLGDDFNRGQDPTRLRGKLLRLDVDTPSDGKNYGIPADNPWAAANDPHDEILDELWAIGLRNPWGVSFDPQTGDLYIGDVGGEPSADSHEEVTFVTADAATGLTRAGMNFEWRIMEGFKVNYPDEVDSFGPGVRVGPIYDYVRGSNTFPDGASVTGGVVYWGCSIPDLRGTYFFGDWTANWRASMRVDDSGALTAPPANRTAELNAGTGSINRPLAFGIDSRGEVYVSMMADSVSRIIPRGG
jgi:hypothetical protein